jgi:hypothetical protein
MREMPATLDAVLESARKLEIVEELQKRLQRSRHQAELCSIAVNDRSSEDVLQANLDNHLLHREMQVSRNLLPKLES